MAEPYARESDPLQVPPSWNIIMPCRLSDATASFSSPVICACCSCKRCGLISSLRLSRNLRHRRLVWNIPCVCVPPVLLELTSIHWLLLEAVQYPSRNPETAATVTHSRLALMNLVVAVSAALNHDAICRIVYHGARSASNSFENEQFVVGEDGDGITASLFP